MQQRMALHPAGPSPKKAVTDPPTPVLGKVVIRAAVSGATNEAWNEGIPFIAPAVNSGWVSFTKKSTTYNPTPRFTMSTLPVEFVDPNGDTWHVDLIVKGWTE